MFSHCHLGRQLAIWDIEPGGYNNSNNNNDNDHHDNNTNWNYFYRRLASFVKILNQEDISKHQNHDTIQEVGSPNKEYLTMWTLQDLRLQHYHCVCVYPNMQPIKNERVCAISFIFQVYFGQSFKLNYLKPHVMSLTSKLAGVSCAKIIILSQDFHFVDPNLYCSAHILISVTTLTKPNKEQLTWIYHGADQIKTMFYYASQPF